MEVDAIRLNLGGGTVEIEGFTTIDRMNGQEVYPLDYEDGTVDEIYASHVLEHFSHTQVAEVINHWTAKLRPGGRMRIAVPDFKWIADQYLKGEPINVQGFAMGGQTDENDYHKAAFDGELLHEMMANAGLERIRRFAPFVKDCSTLPVSLNMQGSKPIGGETVCKGVHACVSVPRFGPTMHMRDSMLALGKARIPYQMSQGAYWHQVLVGCVEDSIKAGAEFILTVDYDTLFTYQDVVELYRLMHAYPDYDAIMPVQMKRGSDFALMGMMDEDGKGRSVVRACEFNRNITRMDTGHFGLTLLRVSALNKLPKPWFTSKPDENGSYGDGHVDADIGFWYNWRDAGLLLGVANRVKVGHLVNMVKWPTTSFGVHYQELSDYGTNGMPAEAL